MVSLQEGMSVLVSVQEGAEDEFSDILCAVTW